MPPPPLEDALQARKPEILAPVGDRNMALAAVAAGADAIYLGVPGFNARGRSAALSFDEIDEIIRLCRRAGVRVYLAFNTLIFEREWDAVLALIPEIVRVAPDALIVQDAGLALLLRHACPEIRLHASTQMTVTDADAMRLYDQVGFSRYVAAREMSLARLESMIQAAHELGREVECFAKGALCISYSGQCLASESFGGGSANRGRCAQSCRFLYDVIVDGSTVAASRYALSARDLDSGEWTLRLAQTGADALKIEGRLKSPEYVYSSVRRLRSLIEGRPGAEPGDLVFSRRAYPAWMAGINHQELVDADVQTHVGEMLGVVVRADNRRSQIVIQAAPNADNNPGIALAPGDGIVIVSEKIPSGRTGGSIYACQTASTAGNTQMLLTFADDLDVGIIPAGARVFRNRSVLFDRDTKAALATAMRSPRVPLTIRAIARIGEPLSVEYEDPEHRVGRAESQGACLPAKNAPLQADALRAELAALYPTPYYAESFSLESPDPVFVHQREWKECRRRAIADLDRQRTERHIEAIDARTTLMRLRTQHHPAYRPESHARPSPPAASRELQEGPATPAPCSTDEPVLHAVLRLPEQASLLPDAAHSASTIYLDFEYGRQVRATMDILREKGYRAGLCTLRVPDDGRNLRDIESLRPDAVLIRHAGALVRFGPAAPHLHGMKASGPDGAGLNLVGDFSLNLSNALSASWFLSRGLRRFTPALDLNASEMHDLLAALRPRHGLNPAGPPDPPENRVEIILHQRIPSFYMQYCLYAKHLSRGTDHRNCGLPCTKHRIALRDPEGEEHAVTTDAACRNTMFRGKIQSMAAFIPSLVESGVRHFRLELLDEDAESSLRLWMDYTELLADPSESAGRKLLRTRGWTEGQLRKAEKPHATPGKARSFGRP